MAASAVREQDSRRRPVVRFDPVRWLPVLAIAAVSVRRLSQMGDVPTGLDGGAWLAIGREVLGGPGRGTDGAYAPLVPALTAALAGPLGPVSAVATVAALAWVGLVSAVAFVASRFAGPPVAAGVVLAVGGASAVAEPLFFGGYPQIVATAAMAATLWWAARWLEHGQPRALAGAAGGLAVAAASHHVYGALALAAAAVLTAFWLLGARGNPSCRWRVGGMVAAVAAGSAALVPTLVAFRDAGYEPPLDAAAFDRFDAWSYATREATWAWTILVVVAVASLLQRRGPSDPAWLVAAALLAVSVPALAAVAEPRLAPPVAIGAVLALARAAGGTGRWRAGVVLAVGAFVAVAGDRVAADYARFYRVLDPSLVAAAGAVAAEPAGGDVAVRADRRGWPVGWWYQGLTGARVLVGSDPRWLGFPEERRDAATVAALFAADAAPSELRQRARAAGVSLLVVPKWDWIGWERWLAAPDPAVAVVFDDDRTLVLRVREATTAAGDAAGPGV